MVKQYTKDDDMQTLRLWYDNKPFTKEIENSIRAIPTTVFSDDIIEDYIQERLKKNNGEYDKPIPKEEPKVEETKESVQEEKAEIQEVCEAIEADACYWDGWNP